MKTIWKFRIEDMDEVTFAIPKGAWNEATINWFNENYPESK